MNRLQELKDKKVWLHGTDEEKAEYKALKEEGMSVVSKPEKQSEDKGELITVKKSDLLSMINEAVEAKTQNLNEEKDELRRHAQSLEKEVGLGDWQDINPNKKRKHTARFKLYRKDTDEDFRLIVDWKHLRFDYNEETRRHDKDICKITVMDENGDKEDVEIELKQFAEIMDYEKVDIIEMDTVKQVKKIGSIRRSGKSRDGYTLSPGVGLEGLERSDGEWVDQLVTRDHTTCTVRRKNGQIFKINANRLNA